MYGYIMELDFSEFKKFQAYAKRKGFKYSFYPVFDNFGVNVTELSKSEYSLLKSWIKRNTEY